MVPGGRDATGKAENEHGEREPRSCHEKQGREGRVIPEVEAKAEHCFHDFLRREKL
jgi:hypothetical protein